MKGERSRKLEKDRWRDGDRVVKEGGKKVQKTEKEDKVMR